MKILLNKKHLATYNILYGIYALIELTAFVLGIFFLCTTTLGSALYMLITVALAVGLTLLQWSIANRHATVKRT